MIDGYPLDRNQAIAFCKDIAKPSIVVSLEVPDEVATTRLTSRGNFDDETTSINKRLQTWNEKTKPLSRTYDAIVIHADRPIGDVLASVEKEIK